MRRHPVLITIAMISVTILLSMVPQSGGSQENDIAAILKDDRVTAIGFMIATVLMKITAFVIGYLTIRLGHDTLIKGISGEIDFGFSGKGFSTKLKSASPGAFFILIGGAIIIWGLTVEKTYFLGPPGAEQQTQGAKFHFPSELGGKSNQERPGAEQQTQGAKFHFPSGLGGKSK